MKNILKISMMLVVVLALDQCTEKDISKGLTVEKVIFNRLGTNGSPVVIEGSPVYKKGDVVVMIMKNIRGFSKGSDSLNRMEMDVTIKGPDKKVLFDQKDMMKENGHVNLPDNVASEPYATYTLDSRAKKGKYHFRVKIWDKVTSKYIELTRVFEVE